MNSNEQTKGGASGEGIGDYDMKSVLLTPGMIWRGTAGLGETCITVLRGTAWVTERCDHNDYVVEAGEELLMRGHGEVLVEALSGVAVALIREHRHADVEAREGWALMSGRMGRSSRAGLGSAAH